MQRPRKVCRWCGRACGAQCVQSARAKPAAFQGRASAAERGYGWGDEWESTRARVLERDPICYLCGKQASAICDHVLAQRLAKRIGSTGAVALRGICKQCNRRKVQRESVVGKLLMREGVTLDAVQVTSLVLWPWTNTGEDPLLARVMR